MRIISNTVIGPSSSTDNALVRWDGTTGQLVQDNTFFTLDDSGNLTGGNVSWNAGGDYINSVSSLSFSTTGANDMNFTAGTGGNINFIAFAGQVNIVADQDCTFGSASGAFILTANTDIDLTATTGAIQLNSNTELGSNLLQLGASNVSSIFYDTGLVLQPDATSNAITIGTATGTSSGDLLINKIGLAGAAISGTAIVNCTFTGAARQALFFSLTYTGTGGNAGPIVCQFFDQGTNATFSPTGVTSQMQLQTTSHTTYVQTGYNTSQGLQVSTTAISTGTYTFYGLRAQMSGQGNGNAGISGGTFRRYGIFQDKMGAINGTPGSDLIMGAYFGNSINVPEGTQVWFDSTTTALGDSGLFYSAANTDLEVQVDGTDSFRFDADKNISKLDFKLDVVGTGLYVKEGTNATMGSATLVAGTVTVNTTKVTANSRIFLTNNANGGTVGSLYISARTAGTSFTITSTNAADTSTVAWLIMEPA